MKRNDHKEGKKAALSICQKQPNLGPGVAFACPSCRSRAARGIGDGIRDKFRCLAQKLALPLREKPKGMVQGRLCCVNSLLFVVLSSEQTSQSLMATTFDPPPRDRLDPAV